MKRVQQKFKMRGLTLTLDAVKAVVKHLEESDTSDDEALDLVLAEMEKVSCKFFLWPLSSLLAYSSADFVVDCVCALCPMVLWGPHKHSKQVHHSFSRVFYLSRFDVPSANAQHWRRFD